MYKEHFSDLSFTVSELLLLLLKVRLCAQDRLSGGRRERSYAL